MILWLLFLLTVLWIFVFKYKRRKLYKLAAMFSGVEDELPVLGIAHKLMGNTVDIMSALQKYSCAAMDAKCNGIITGWLGHCLYFVVVNPVDLELVLKTCLEKDNLYRFLRAITGNGGVFAPVSIWRRRRKILVPAFSPKIVENFVEVFSERSEKLAAKLDSKVNTGQFSMWPFLSTYTFDSVCETAMGIKINAQNKHHSSFLTALNRMLNLVCERMLHLWLHPDWLYQFFPQRKELYGCIKQMHDFTDEIIEKKRYELKTEQGIKTEVDNHFDLVNYKAKTFLDLLISLSGGEKGYNNVELREEVLTLAAAGTDTSAVSIGFTLKLMAKYPKIQEKVYQELLDVFGDTDRPLVKEDLMKLKYLERVVKESLRLFPSVPFIIRKITEDTTLPSGRVLPGGSGVLASIWGIHRDPKYWGPEAENFDPDRFLPERFNLPHSCCYMPFSNGPRNCVGYQYALMSIKTGLSAILRRYKVVGEEETGPAPHIEVKLDIMMKAVDGYQVGLERRRPESL